MQANESVQSFLEILSQSLRFFSESGLSGYECSEQTLDVLRSWAVPLTRKNESLGAIRETIGDCRKCGLHRMRNHIVFGSGDPNAKLIFIGEGPGRDEDLRGEPFVGVAGELLTKIIHAIRLTREAVYICNIVKCRPPRNREPEADEIKACLPFLKQQIQAVRPEFIVTLGSTAARTLLETDQPISKLRGRFHDVDGIRLLPTYHPAYLLRKPEKKRDVWEDMKLLMQVYPYDD